MRNTPIAEIKEENTTEIEYDSSSEFNANSASLNSELARIRNKVINENDSNSTDTFEIIKHTDWGNIAPEIEYNLISRASFSSNSSEPIIIEANYDTVKNCEKSYTKN